MKWIRGINIKPTKAKVCSDNRFVENSLSSTNFNVDSGLSPQNSALTSWLYSKQLANKFNINKNIYCNKLGVVRRLRVVTSAPSRSTMQICKRDSSQSYELRLHYTKIWFLLTSFPSSDNRYFLFVVHRSFNYD